MHGRFLTILRFSARPLVTAALITQAFAACAGTAPRPIPPAYAPCEGPTVAVVRNETGAPIEVYVFVGKVENLLGTATSGRSEFALPPRPDGDYAFNARTLSGEPIRLSRPSQSPASRVSISVECR